MYGSHANQHMAQPYQSQGNSNDSRGFASEETYNVAYTLFAGDLSTVCTEDHLHELLSPFGNIINIRIQKSKKNISLGYAFVLMEDPVAASNAIANLDGLMFCGRKLRLGKCIMLFPYI